MLSRGVFVPNSAQAQKPLICTRPCKETRSRPELGCWRRGGKDGARTGATETLSPLLQGAKVGDLEHPKPSSLLHTTALLESPCETGRPGLLHNQHQQRLQPRAALGNPGELSHPTAQLPPARPIPAVPARRGAGAGAGAGLGGGAGGPVRSLHTFGWGLPGERQRRWQGFAEAQPERVAPSLRCCRSRIPAAHAARPRCPALISPSKAAIRHPSRSLRVANSSRCPRSQSPRAGCRGPGRPTGVRDG